MLLSRQTTALIDLEGTVYTREGVIDGAAQAIAELRSINVVLRFLTNKDSEATPTIIKRLSRMGIGVNDNEVFTPVTAARELIRNQVGARVLTLTSREVRNELAEVLRIVGPEDSPTHVIVGDLRDNLDYGLLDRAFGALAAGAQLVALQRGRYYLSNGQAHLDTGAIVAALEYAAETRATVVGKPNPQFLKLAIATVNPMPAPDCIWMVGDDASTDIRMGNSAGVHTVQVKTGKYGPHSGIRTEIAELVLESLAGLPALFRAPQ